MTLKTFLLSSPLWSYYSFTGFKLLKGIFPSIKSACFLDFNFPYFRFRNLAHYFLGRNCPSTGPVFRECSNSFLFVPMYVYLSGLSPDSIYYSFENRLVSASLFTFCGSFVMKLVVFCYCILVFKSILFQCPRYAVHD